MNPIHLQSYIHPPKIHMSKVSPTGPPGRYQKDVSPSSLRRNVFRIVGKFGEKLGGIFPGVHVGKINENIGILPFFWLETRFSMVFFPEIAWGFPEIFQVTTRLHLGRLHLQGVQPSGCCIASYWLLMYSCFVGYLI